MFTWKDLFNTPPSILTVVGMAKNAGKTVAMNYVQAMLNTEGYRFGITSVGRDGEQFDALTLLAKPAVVVEQGTLVATAEATVLDRDRWEVLEQTAVRTPLGAVGVFRALSRNQVILAGPSKNSEVQAVVKILTGYGAGCVIIDGAFDRQSSADPAVSDQVILATGATLNRSIDELVALTRIRVEQLSLPLANVDDNWLAGMESRVVAIIGGERKELPVSTTLLGEDAWWEVLRTGADTLILRGAVGDGLAEALLRYPGPPKIVVMDGSKIFIRSELWRRLVVKDVNISAIKAINLLGVTVNPTFPSGEGLHPDELLTAMGKALYPLPVLDIVREKKFQP